MQPLSPAPVQSSEEQPETGLPPRPVSCPPQWSQPSLPNGQSKNGNGGATWSIMNWVMTGGKSYCGTMGNAGSYVDLLGLMKESARSTMGDHDAGDYHGGAGADDGHGSGDVDEDDGPERVDGKAWRPLSRKVKIPDDILNPYRLLVFGRITVLVLFLMWRISHVNTDAVWLWAASVGCEIWFVLTWVLEQLPNLWPINRVAYIGVLKERFEENLKGRSELPGIDVFISTVDPEQEPLLVTANTVLSVLAADYPAEKLACYLSDDSATLVTLETMAETAHFAKLWVPFCRKHSIEPRSPERYFGLTRDPYKDQVRPDYIRDRRFLKREYDKFKVRLNALPDLIRRRSNVLNAREEVEAMRQFHLADDDIQIQLLRKKLSRATWMSNATHWAGAWLHPSQDHTKWDHAGIVQVLSLPQGCHPQCESHERRNGMPIDFKEVDPQVPMLVYVSCEKRRGYDNNKKAGAMNALLRASAVMSNGPFVLYLDCDQYVYNSQALREAMCFMIDHRGENVAFIQFPLRTEGVNICDRYSNRNRVFFNVNMRGLDGLQGPVYAGTNCMFRRIALYGFDPPKFNILYQHHTVKVSRPDDEKPLLVHSNLPGKSKWLKRFGNSHLFLDSIEDAENQAKPLPYQPEGKSGHKPVVQREALTQEMVREAIGVVSCGYEEKTKWGRGVGWVYGSLTEHIVTGYKMHNRGWSSIYCIPKRDAFRCTVPINLTITLHKALWWATGSVEIFLGPNNAIFAGPRLNFLQRIAYLNIGIYPFTSIFLIVYCFIPAISIFTDQFIVKSLSVIFLAYLLGISVSLSILGAMEMRWSGITLDDWWRNQQFWMIGGTSAHIIAILRGIVKLITGTDISFAPALKSGQNNEEELADLYVVKWTFLMVLPITIMMTNVVAITVGITREIFREKHSWGKLIGGVCFSIWVLVHLFPFAKDLVGRRGKTPTIVFIWSGLIAITIALLTLSINPSSAAARLDFSGSFSFP
ncbi:Cellulose synthase family protein [Rhynchospora pubera]|uniref:Cellulose synthase family protein n=1 Tax=Rhynchospora pubera TaxID=906938 RepID=A0AAV8GPB8_9POAL|nr:Cellulose synthase family protein [Rhynchospora pubera]